MVIENQEVIYCEDDREHRVYCDICDKTIKLESKNKHQIFTKNSINVNI